MKTLLEKAKSTNVKRMDKMTNEDYELVKAYLRDEVTISQMATAKGYITKKGQVSTSKIYAYISYATKAMHSEGLLKIN